MKSRKIWALAASLISIVALQAGGWADAESLNAIETVAIAYMGGNVGEHAVSALRGASAGTSKVAPGGEKGGNE